MKNSKSNVKINTVTKYHKAMKEIFESTKRKPMSFSELTSLLKVHKVAGHLLTVLRKDNVLTNTEGGKAKQGRKMIWYPATKPSPRMARIYAEKVSEYINKHRTKVPKEEEVVSKPENSKKTPIKNSKGMLSEPIKLRTFSSKEEEAESKRLTEELNAIVRENNTKNTDAKTIYYKKLISEIAKSLKKAIKEYQSTTYPERKMKSLSILWGLVKIEW